MNVREELRTFSNDAFDLSTQLVAVADKVALRLVASGEAAAEIDRIARDLIGVAEVLKELAARLKAGQERVATIQSEVKP